MFELFHSLIYRPYVTLFLLAFLALSWIEQGKLRTAIWLVTGYLIAMTAEWMSIGHGVPFGWYHYRYENLEGDLLIAGVPFFDSLSFAFLSYVSFSFAQFFLSPLRRRGWDIQRVTPRNIRNSAAVLFLGAFLMVVLDLVIDPVTHLGKHWFLGDIYYYSSPGYHFDVTLANYVGWFVVGWLIIFVNQRIDTFLGSYEQRKGEPLKLPYVPGKALFAPLFWAGIAGFVLAVTAWLGWGYDLSKVEHNQDAWADGVRKMFLAGCFIILPILVLAWAHVIRPGNRPSDEMMTAWLADYPCDRFKDRG